jgi:peptidoglycan LD-endopeptidase LytH
MYSSWPPSHEPDSLSTSAYRTGDGRSALLVLLASALAVLGTLAYTERPAAPPPAGETEAVRVALSTTIAEDPLDELTARHLLMPVKGFPRTALRDNFNEKRGLRPHEALDIMAPRNTPVVAVDDGRIAKLYRSVAGGITIYQYDPAEHYAYYYAHLDHYASGLVEGAQVKRGEVIGYVGTSGNAPANAPHLHFTVFKLGPEKHWWRGKAINPFAFLNER